MAGSVLRSSRVVHSFRAGNCVLGHLMSSRAVKVLCGMAGLLPLAGASAAEITVLGPDGLPLQDVAVTCARGVAAVDLTDEGGRCLLPESCREAECARGGFLSGRTPIDGPSATCRLARPLLLRGEVPALRDAEEPHFVVLRISESHPVLRSAWVERAHQEEAGRFRMEPAPPGPYELVGLRLRDEWSCATELGQLPAGEREVLAGWRDPAEVTGVVVDPEGKPFARVLLRIDYGDEDAAIGSTRCAMWEQALDIVSDRDGRCRARVDPARTPRIVIDPAWAPATIRIDGAKETVGDGVRNPD